MPGKGEVPIPAGIYQHGCGIWGHWAVVAALEEWLDSISRFASHLVAHSDADCFLHAHQTTSTGKATPEFVVTSPSKEHETFLLSVS